MIDRNLPYRFLRGQPLKCVEHQAQHSVPILIAVYDVESDQTKIGTLTVTVEASEALLDLYNDE